MDTSGADDGTDFRPFFDMVIGILFVLLILVAAQVYFQQVQDQPASSETARREAALRRADIAAYLGALAGRLHAGGLDPTVDAESGTVLLPLREILAVDPAGRPAVLTAPATVLGDALARLGSCVTVPRSAAPECSAFERLRLDALAVTVRVGALSPRVSLARDRFTDLAATLLSARVLGGNPALIGESNAAGGRVVTFGSALDEARAAETDIDGEVALDFTFD